MIWTIKKTSNIIYPDNGQKSEPQDLDAVLKEERQKQKWAQSLNPELSLSRPPL